MKQKQKIFFKKSCELSFSQRLFFKVCTVLKRNSPEILRLELVNIHLNRTSLEISFNLALSHFKTANYGCLFVAKTYFCIQRNYIYIQ